MSFRLLSSAAALSKLFSGGSSLGARCFVTANTPQSAVDKLPKAPTATNLFLRDEVARLKKQNLPIKNAMAEVMPLWKTLTPEKKQPFIAEAAKLKQEYVKAKSLLSKEDQVVIKQMDRQRRQERAIRRFKTQRNKAAKKYGRPKAPPGLFGLFVQERFDTKRYPTVVDGVKDLGKQWSALSSDAKAVYKKKHDVLQAAYMKDLATWETKMEKQGENNVVELFKTAPPNKAKEAKAKKAQVEKQKRIQRIKATALRRQRKVLTDRKKRQAQKLKARERLTARKAKEVLARTVKRDQQQAKKKELAAARQHRLDVAKQTRLDNYRATAAKQAKAVQEKLKVLMDAKNPKMSQIKELEAKLMVLTKRTMALRVPPKRTTVAAKRSVLRRKKSTVRRKKPSVSLAAKRRTTTKATKKKSVTKKSTKKITAAKKK